MFPALRAMLRSPEGKVIALWATGQIALGTAAYMWLEGWSAVDALYFSVVTLATVGFGDLHPTSAASKVFTVAYIVFGLGVIAAFVSELTRHQTARITRHRARRHRQDPPAGPVVADPPQPATYGTDGDGI